MVRTRNVSNESSMSHSIVIPPSTWSSVVAREHAEHGAFEFRVREDVRILVRIIKLPNKVLVGGSPRTSPRKPK